MAASKAARRLPGRPRRLPEEDLQRLRAELARPPSKLGFPQARRGAANCWSSTCATTMTSCSGRANAAASFEQSKRIATTVPAKSDGRKNRPRKFLPPERPIAHRCAANSDHASKEIALRRIKRICSSGLPLYPLARALFELIGDAIPQGANRVLMADDGRHPDRYVTSSSELARWTPVHKHFFIDSPPQVSGTIPVPSILQGGVVRTHEEIVLPHFHRSEGYNECLRHIGFITR